MLPEGKEGVLLYCSQWRFLGSRKLAAGPPDFITPVAGGGGGVEVWVWAIAGDGICRLLSPLLKFLCRSFPPRHPPFGLLWPLFLRDWEWWWPCCCWLIAAGGPVVEKGCFLADGYDCSVGPEFDCAACVDDAAAPVMRARREGGIFAPGVTREKFGDSAKGKVSWPNRMILPNFEVVNWNWPARTLPCLFKSVQIQTLATVSHPSWSTLRLTHQWPVKHHRFGYSRPRRPIHLVS